MGEDTEYGAYLPIAPVLPHAALPTAAQRNGRSE